MGLQSPHLGALRILADPLHLARVHRVLGQGGLFQEILHPGRVEGVANDLCQLGENFGAFSVPNGIEPAQPREEGARWVS